MTKKIFLLMMVFVLSVSTVFAAAKPNTNAEENLNGSVVDTAKILSANQIQTLTAKIQQLEQKHKIKIGINFLKSIGGQNIDTVANERLRKYFGNGQNGGIILVVDMQERNWNIALDAKLNQRILSYSDVAYKHDDFYDKLHNNDFFGAANAYLDTVDELLNYYETNGEPYDSFNEFNPLALGIGVLIAIVIGFGIRSWLIGSMSNVKFASEALDYLKRENVKITENRDTYLFTNVSRRPKSKGSNGSGGRGSGGGSSGGGSF
ncbi:MAG: TPM domain-containing protein [Selenomonadaceae bacterium]|nr:TPM domain-containing protein [Selenomonadaceae bacterium]